MHSSPDIRYPQKTERSRWGVSSHTFANQTVRSITIPYSYCMPTYPAAIVIHVVRGSQAGAG